MSVTRTVREDQHGTMTGYNYGCRCTECRGARRERGAPVHSVSDETLERVFEALEHEADLDDVVTASGERLGELAGISAASANWAVNRLAQLGRVVIVGESGRGSVRHVHLGGAA